MMKQITLFRPNIKTDNKSPIEQPLKFSKNMTIKGKKNSKVKIVTNKKRHNYWGNIFRRKRIMSEYFSDSAFGSQSDTKIELYNPWDDEEKMIKFRYKQQRYEYEYDENETLPTINIAFINDPNTYYHLNNKKQENKNNDTT
jgi:hypothetical protein